MKRVNMLFLLSVFFLFSCEKSTDLMHNKFSGNVFGTYYNVQFFSENKVDYNKQLDSIFIVLNNSMSTYQSNSLISKINKGATSVKIDNHFRKVFEASKIIYSQTNGVFDPTIGDVVNAWSFGPKKEIIKVDSVLIDTLMNSVGFDKVELNTENLILKESPTTFLDFNAIAKGYALDVIAGFLDKMKHDNYLIDIGGEVLAKGKKPNNLKWKVGIDRPNFDGLQETQKIIELTNAAMATSGVYRKFKVDKQGKKYAHIINTKTGYPSKTNVLSVSVIAANCMIADAYATAFQVMGVDKTKEFIANRKDLKVCFIYEENAIVKTLPLNGFPD